MRTENDSNKEGRPVDTMEPLDHTRGVKFLSAVRKALRRHSEHAQNDSSETPRKLRWRGSKEAGGGSRNVV